MGAAGRHEPGGQRRPGPAALEDRLRRLADDHARLARAPGAPAAALLTALIGVRDLRDGGRLTGGKTQGGAGACF